MNAPKGMARLSLSVRRPLIVYLLVKCVSLCLTLPMTLLPYRKGVKRFYT